MRSDVVIIGTGLGSLTAAALLARRGLKVVLLEQHYQPGGSCGSFRRGSRTFDQGTSMFFGFGKEGFNPLRFVFNQLSEPITLLQHPALYQIDYKGHLITFSSDMEAYFQELEQLFPKEIDGIRRFYDHIGDLYRSVIVDDPIYTAPSEMRASEGLSHLLRHPVREARFLRLFRMNAAELLGKFTSSPEVLGFFSKLTSTYCYTTLEETPAVMAATMFMDNHLGGSYYPVGSSQQLPGKLERSIEGHGGTFIYQCRAYHILFSDGKPSGVSGVGPGGEQIQISADEIIYGGTLHDLYHQLLPKEQRSEDMLSWVDNLKMTYPSVVLYCAVEASVIPDDAQPIVMFADNPEAIDEKEIMMYRFSLADHSICPVNEHLVMAIGPSLRSWPGPDDPTYDSDEYLNMKEEETQRILDILEAHMPGFRKALRYHTLATPSSIEFFTLKNNGAAAGPKQQMGQELLKRHHASTRWDSLFVCGEATVMGTGAPAVTISGISAANLILRKRGLKEFRPEGEVPDVVRILKREDLSIRYNNPYEPIISANTIEDEHALELHDLACRCQWCADDACRTSCPYHIDIRGIMRRLECGNLEGARQQVRSTMGKIGHRSVSEQFHPCSRCDAPCEKQCLHNLIDNRSIPIQKTLQVLFDQ